MSCQFCHDALISKMARRMRICMDCYSDPEIVISLSEIKKKYKLTDCDNTFAKIPGQGYNKYLLMDVHRLITKLVKDLPDSDKKKLAYNRQNDIILNIQEKNKVIEKRIQNIKNDVKELVVKVINRQDYQFGDYINLVIESNAREHLDISENDIVKFILTIIQKQELRKEQIDSLILKNFTEKKYRDMAFKRSEYDTYITNDKHDLNISFNAIANYVNKFRDKHIRAKELKKLINENWSGEDRQFALDSKIYYNFVMEGNITNIKMAMQYITSSIENKHLY